MLGVTEERATTAGAGRRGSGRRIAVGLLAVVLVAVLVWVVAVSSILGASTVTVRGAKLLPAAAVRNAAAIKPGTPLLRLDAGAVERRVEALPEVRSARVHTSYPSTVTIDVVERVAVGYRDLGGSLSLIDADNVSFRSVKAAPRGLPKLADTGQAPGDQAIAAVAGSLSAAVAGRVASISAASPESVTLVLSDGRTVLWGGTDRNSDKAKLLPALLGQPGRFFDVSDPDSVISR